MAGSAARAAGMAGGNGGGGMSFKDAINKARSQSQFKKDLPSTVAGIKSRLDALEGNGKTNAGAAPAPVQDTRESMVSTMSTGLESTNLSAPEATSENFSPQAQTAAEGIFGGAEERAASVQPPAIETPEASATEELGALFDKPETSYSSIGGL